MQTVAIFGVGLIGGSFALALRKAGFSGRILGVSSPATLEDAKRLGVIDEGVSLARAAELADLLYLAQPVRTIIETVTQLDLFVTGNTLVTDVGSTKAVIVEAASRTFKTAVFLGGHPMAGKETRGVAEADPDLFRGRAYVLTPGESNDMRRPQILDFFDWIERIGAIPHIMSPKEHDRIVALTSHLPQLVSTALASIVGEHPLASENLGVSGSGLLDTTRLGMSSYDVWGDILGTNEEFVSQALMLYIDKLHFFRDNLTTSEIRKEFHIAAETVRKLRAKP